MKTLILYATKHGGAAEVARLIAALFEGSVTFNLKNDDIPSLDEFECIIIGSPVYAGSFLNEAKSYLSANAEKLCKKKLGIFACGMSKNESNEAFKANIPENVLAATTAVCASGGIFNPEKANFFEKLIIRIVTKQKGYINNISGENILEFAEAMKE